MSRPAELAASWWSEYAHVRVELGTVDSWLPNGVAWDSAEWDVSRWGESYLTPSRWVDVTADVLSLDVDTGRNGIDDPGDVGTVSLVLFDPLGDYRIAGADRYAVGNLLHVVVEHVASGRSRSSFYGKVTDATGHGDLAAPSTSLSAVDLVGVLLSTDDDEPLPADSVTGRLAELCDRAGLPAELRELADDPTALLAVEKAGNRLDAARGAVSSSVGGTLYATGEGTIRYSFGAFLVEPDRVAEYSIGTVAGSVCPSSLDLVERGGDVRNVYSYKTQADEPLVATAIDERSVKRFGRASNVRTDLLNADAAQLRGLVQAEIARTAWAPERVDSCSIDVQDDASAELVLVAVAELVDFAYTGSAPWSARQLVGGFAHHITPDSWTIDLRAYPAIVETQWDRAAWDVDTWSLGAVPMRELEGAS